MRDHKARPPVIPPSVLAKMAEDNAAMDAEEVDSDDEKGVELDPDYTGIQDTPINMSAVPKRKLQKDIMWEMGGPGVYSSDWRKDYKLRNPEWAYDVIPEIVDGKNIADFVDPDIEARLLELEREEEARVAAGGMEEDGDDDDDEEALDDEQMEQLRRIREKRIIMKSESNREKTKNKSSLSTAALGKRSRTEAALEEHLEELGMDAEQAEEVTKNVFNRLAKNKGEKEVRMVDSGSDNDEEERRDRRPKKRARFGAAVEEEETEETIVAKREKADSLARARGFADEKMRVRAKKIESRKQSARFRRFRTKGEADRSVGNAMPRHLFSGKRKGQHTASHR